ncbi:MAG: hypothetical protein B9S26_14460 [Opitutia bacterium Tous-C4FEB]|nr:MAG: hypothetical protein B9S26_14460 [Opitutae bacterium Tous-C4FEB]
MDFGRVLILNTLAPVFLLIALGAGLQASRFLSPGFLREANRVVYWVGLPALLFSQLARLGRGVGDATPMLGVMLVATVAVALISYPVAAWMGVRPGAKGTFAQAVLRGNLAFVGLPIIYELPDVTLAGGLSLRAAAVLTVAPMMVLFNITSVMALLASQHKVGWAMAWPLLKQLASTPPLVASLAGLSWAWAGWTLPTMLDQALGSLGEMALPLGLLGVGGSLVTVNLGGKWATPLAAALLKTLAAPALGWLVGRWAGLGPVELKTVMIFLAAPTAVVSFTVASELKGDEPLAAGAIVVSTLTSMVTLAIIVGVF